MELSRSKNTVKQVHAQDFGHIGWIDYARFLAAMAVVLNHYFYEGFQTGLIAGTPPSELLFVLGAYGHMGVELFFAISGFVILKSVEGKTAEQFVYSRFRRLYPAFWFALFLTTTTLIILPQPWANGCFFCPTFLANATMVPKLWGPFAYVDPVYWTLYAEMQFYFFVLLIMLFRQRHHTENIIYLWGVAQIAAIVLDKQRIFFGDPYIFFVVGSAYYYIYKHGWSAKRFLILLASFIITIWTYANSNIAIDALFYTVIISAIYLVFALFALRQTKLSGNKFLGSLTYPMYLLHAYIGFALINTLSPSLGIWGGILLATAVTFALAAFTTLVIEKTAHKLLPNRVSKPFPRKVNGNDQRS